MVCQHFCNYEGYVLSSNIEMVDDELGPGLLMRGGGSGGQPRKCRGGGPWKKIVYFLVYIILCVIFASI
jgi:hypothetical protein